MLKRLGKCIREYWLVSILAPLSVIGEVVMSVLIPYKMADLIDYGVDAGNMEVIRQVGGTLFWYALIAMALGIASGILASIAGSGFATNLRHDMFYSIMNYSFANVDKFSTAGLVTRMTTDVTRLQLAYSLAVRMLFRVPANFIFAMVMAFRVNKRLSLIFLAAIPVLLVGLIIIMKKAMPLFEKMFKVFDKMNQTIQENVRGIRVVKSFVREEYEKDKFKDVATENKNLSVAAEKIVAWNGPLMSFAAYGCSIAICWFGAKMITVGDLTTGQLMSIMSYIMLILTSLMLFSLFFIMGSQAIASAKRVVEVLDEVPDIKNCNKPAYKVKDGSIKFENVSFGYGEGKDCLSGLDFEIKSGETIGIIGGTGTGKTSLVSLIPRLYDVRSGRVLVGGKDVKNIDITTLRQNVAMVLQKNILFDGTIRDNLKWGNENATDEEMWNALSLAMASDFVKDIMPDGLDSHIEQGGANVSGGQRQRLCIARALLTNPKILILDDSTSAVDTATESKIRKGFKKFIPETTKIIIAQRISSVKDADRIIVLDDGKISGIGTHKQLIKSNKIYQEVYESQTKGGDFDEPSAN